jgi:hypothetical protein
VFRGAKTRRELIRRATQAESDAAATRAELHAAHASIRGLQKYAQELADENRTLREAHQALDEAIKRIQRSRERLNGASL